MNPTSESTPYEYYVGGSLEINDPTYVTRQADQDFYEILRAGNFCYVFNSRQMGKSSLRVRTMQRLQSEGFACASIYITSIGSQNITPDKWYAGIIQRLVNSFGLDDRINLRNWLRERDVLSPVQRFSEFIETVILREIAGRVVIFVDEIDSVLSLDFGIDDFFAVIRECYDRRGSQPDYKRLTFALLGVIAPADLIKDKRRTPFNTLSRAIDLTGFSLEEAMPLAVGLREKAEESVVMLQEVLGWTGGQPFLTQKVCKLLATLPSRIEAGQEGEVVERVIREQVVERWEEQDVPEHLKTISDRLLRGNKNEQLTGRLLGLCQQILEADLVQEHSLQPSFKMGGVSLGIPADESYEQMQLRLTGLAVQRDGRLIIYNAIYAEIFNSGWVERALTSLRPPFYAVAMAAWQEAGEEQKGEFLLRGQALQEAEAWAKNKRLSNVDEEFLAVSREFEKQETEQKLRATEEANILLLAAERKARQRVQFGSVFLVLALVLAAIAWASATVSVNEAKQATERLKETEAKRQELSDKATQAEEQVKSAQKKVEETDQQAKQNEKLAAEKQREAEQIRQQAEEASQNEKLAAEKQKEAEQRVGEANQNLLAARTNLESLQGQSAESQIRLAQATAQVKAAEVQVNAAEQQRQQSLQALMAAEEKAIITEQRVTKVERDVLVGRINLSVFESRSAFSNGQKFDALLKALRAKVQLESLGKEAWPDDDSKSKITLALQQAVYAVQEKDRFQHIDAVLSVAFSPDGKTIASGGFDQNVTLWSTEGERLKIFTGHSARINKVSFSPDGKVIASASNDNTIKLWNLDGQLLKTLNGHSDQIESVVFSPDGKVIASVSNDKTIKLWNLDGQLLQTFNEQKVGIPNEREAGILSLVFSPDGKTIATGDRDGILKLWNIDGKELKRFRAYSFILVSLAFSPDGKTIATGGRSAAVKLVDVEKSWNLNEQEFAKTFLATGDSVNSVAFSPDGKNLAYTSGDKNIEIITLESKENKKIRVLTGHGNYVSSISFSPDGKTIATGSFDNTVRLWDSEEGWKSQTLTTHRSLINNVIFSPDGKTIATGSNDTTVKLWNLDGKELQTLAGHITSVKSIAFSPDSQTIATGSDDNTVKLWSLDGKELKTFTGHSSGVTSVAFSPDGQTIATGSDDKTVKLWSLDGKELQTIDGHSSSVSSVVFSPDGKTLATGNLDKTIKLWNLEGKNLLTSINHDNSVTSLAFSPDSKTIVAGSSSIVNTRISTSQGFIPDTNSPIAIPNSNRTIIAILNHLLSFARCKMLLVNDFTHLRRVKSFRIAIVEPELILLEPVLSYGV